MSESRAPISLSMMKMEKNFIAHLEKKYPRNPYTEYPIFIRNNNENTLLGFVWREMIELNRTIDTLDRMKTSFELGYKGTSKDILDQILKSLWEVADVSNMLDYLFEGLLKAYVELTGDEIE